MREFAFATLDIAADFNPVTSDPRTTFKISKTPLQTGDFVKIFNSITAGDELMRVTFDPVMDKKDFQEYQAGMDQRLWMSLFQLKLPCRLETSSRVIEGKLYPFLEQGMEGRPDWTVFDFQNNSYDSTHWLKKGDLLTIYSRVTDGGIYWQGDFIFEDDTQKTVSLSHRKARDQTVLLASADTDANGQPENLYVMPVSERFARVPIRPDLKVVQDMALY